MLIHTLLPTVLLFSSLAHHGRCITILGFNLDSLFFQTKYDPEYSVPAHSGVSFFWGPHFNQTVLSDLEVLFKSKRYMKASKEDRKKKVDQFMVKWNIPTEKPKDLVRTHPDRTLLENDRVRTPDKIAPHLENKKTHHDSEVQLVYTILTESADSASDQAVLNNRGDLTSVTVRKTTADRVIRKDNETSSFFSNQINPLADPIASSDKLTDQLFSTNVQGLTNISENFSQVNNTITKPAADIVLSSSRANKANLSIPAEMSRPTLPDETSNSRTSAAKAFFNTSVPEINDIENFLRKKRKIKINLIPKDIDNKMDLHDDRK